MTDEVTDEARETQLRIIIFEEASRLLEKEPDSAARQVATSYVIHRREGFNDRDARRAVRAISSDLLVGHEPKDQREGLKEGLELGVETWLNASES